MWLLLQRARKLQKINSLFPHAIFTCKFSSQYSKVLFCVVRRVLWQNRAINIANDVDDDDDDNNKKACVDFSHGFYFGYHATTLVNIIRRFACQMGRSREPKPRGRSKASYPAVFVYTSFWQELFHKTTLFGVT